MSWEAVPWMVDGGRHSADVGRLLAYAATGGGQGIVRPGDLRVRALDVPGGQVLVGPGAALIGARDVGADEAQTYVARNPDDDVVAVAATGAGGGRSDLVVARVEDPQFAPWQAPADPATGPYVFTRVIAGVPAGTTSAAELGVSESMVALARIDIPASTAAITDAMITDLRQLAQPRRHREVLMTQPITDGTVADLTSTAFVDFPAWAPQVPVPEWATRCDVVTTISGLAHTDQLWADLRVHLGAKVSSAVILDLDAGATGSERATVMVAGGWPDVADVAGTTQTVKTTMRIRPDEPAGHDGLLRVLRGTTVVHEIDFSERPL